MERDGGIADYPRLSPFCIGDKDLLEISAAGGQGPFFYFANFHGGEFCRTGNRGVWHGFCDAVDGIRERKNEFALVKGPVS